MRLTRLSLLSKNRYCTSNGFKQSVLQVAVVFRRLYF